ncbi:MAG: biopolymer transporter ExbD [Planctomycetota bacterium]|nr:biopolymer transporter ExbD [Planctomycetota bacterium]
MSAAMSHGSSAEPDLTPILDLVFQLITFFMLVINFKAAALDTSLRLPVIGSARPIDSKGVDDVLVLNVNKEGSLNVYGDRKSDIKRYIANEATASRMLAKRKGKTITNDDDLPTTVVIRADRGVSFNLLNKVLTECQKYGFRKFTFKAQNLEK